MALESINWEKDKLKAKNIQLRTHVVNQKAPPKQPKGVSIRFQGQKA